MSKIQIDLDPHPKQYELLMSKGTEVGYGGAAGGGKSMGLRFEAIRACSAIPGCQVYLFRKHYGELIQNHVDGPGGFRELLAPWIAAKEVEVLIDKIRFPNGSMVHLCHCSHQKHLENYYSIEMQLLLVDQAEQFPERWLRILRHRVRMPKAMKAEMPRELKAMFPRIVYSFNPGGVSHAYFRRQFAKAKKPMQVWRTPDDEGGFKRQFIPARLEDNPSLDAKEYARTLKGLNDPQMIRALLEGDMDALVGNYFPEFWEERHVVADFVVPTHWFKYRTLDLGYSEPFAVVWWAVSDGEAFKSGGETRWFPPGALIAYREWYGCDPNSPAKGLRMRNEDIAKGILERTPENTSGITLTDSLPFQDRGMGSKRTYTPADLFFEAGVPLTKGNTARIHGWAQLRDRLIGEELDEGWSPPLIYFTESCAYCRDYLPALERHDTRLEDAAEKGEATHICDAIRLACTARPLTLSKPPFTERTDPHSIVFGEQLAAHLKTKRSAVQEYK